MFYEVDKEYRIRVKPPYHVSALMLSDGAQCSMSCKSHQKGINLFKLITVASCPPTCFLIHISHPHKPLFFKLERHTQGEILYPQNVSRCSFLASCLETLLFSCCCIFIFLPSFLYLPLSALFVLNVLYCAREMDFLCLYTAPLFKLVYFCFFSLYNSIHGVSFYGTNS